MTSRRILFCDDDPDIREIIELSLRLDASFELKGCVSAAEALAAAAAWGPDIVLLDVMMPGMDGPTALAMLHANPCTTSIPVVFMTARTQAYECQRFIALGAAGVIAKPFDPMTLASLVRGYLPDGERVTGGRERFRLRLDQDQARLAQSRSDLRCAGDLSSVLASVRDIAHEFVATAGVCGFCGICGLSEFIDAAVAVEKAATGALAGGDGRDAVVRALDRLLAQMPPQAPPVPREHAALTANAV
jgi:two-component system, OmpR family, response regulator